MFWGRKWAGRQRGVFMAAVMGYSINGYFGVEEFRRLQKK
jgi:hypothetical protein